MLARAGKQIELWAPLLGGATELATPKAAHVSEVVGVAAAAAVALDFPADGTGACAPAPGHGVLVR